MIYFALVTVGYILGVFAALAIIPSKPNMLGE
ncbi:MAG: hypothetical protein UR17_C0001G0055 [Candidatus Woesebacteria bacterium GW2011_GWF1_31_35]|nr:MAG: hypothetical protein UR17_C0001G0055 [Candidatus Woesebacteria bacterium GW2011_GWF1_31_35]